MDKIMEERHPGFLDNQNKAFSTAQNMPMPRNGDVLRIPVVFHVIYNTDKQNIPDEYIYNQMEVINDAYRNRHGDTANTRPVFKHLAADAEIEFFWPISTRMAIQPTALPGPKQILRHLVTSPLSWAVSIWNILKK